MRLHLGKEADYEQKDLIVGFESNESHLLVVSQDLNARIALMKLFGQNFKTANKELLFHNAEKRLARELDELKKTLPHAHAKPSRERFRHHHKP